MIRKIYSHPWIIITFFLAITVFFALQLGNIEIENSTKQFLPQEHESYLVYTDMEDRYGSAEMVSIVLMARQGSIITADNINTVKRITDRLENTYNIDNVTSLSNTDYVYGEDGSLIVKSLVDSDFTGSGQQLLDIREKLVSWGDMYDRVIISDDWKSTQMAISFEKDISTKEKQKALTDIRTIMNEEVTDPNLSVTMVGNEVVNENAEIFMRSDLVRLIPLVILVVLLCLFISFQTLEGVLLPLVTVLVSTIWSIGVMAINNITFTITSSLIPVALIAVGSAYGIHVLNHYYSALRETEGEITKEKHLDVVLAGLKSVLPGVCLAGLTTIVGFISLIGSPLIPLRSFAAFTALGIAFALFLSITFIPSLLMVKKVKNITNKTSIFAVLKRKLASGAWQEDTDVKSTGEINVNGKHPLLYRLYRVVAGNPLRLIIFSACIILFAFIGIRMLVIDSAMINYFPPDSALRQDINFVDSQFAGTDVIYLLVDGQEKGDLTKPEILKAIDELQVYLTDNYESVGKVVSFTTFVKRMNQVMHIPEAYGYYNSYENYDEDIYENEGFEDSQEPSSFIDEEDYGFSSFVEDEDDYGFSSFVDSFAEEDIYYDDYTDPNIEYSRKLDQTITVREGLEMLGRAYTLAGGGNASLQGMMETLERELNYRGAAYYEIPYDPDKYPAATRDELKDLVSQYLLLFSGSLDGFIDDDLQPGAARIMIQMRSSSTRMVDSILKDIEEYASRYFPEGYTVKATGYAELEYVMTNLIVSSQISSLIFSLACVFLILTVYFRSVLAGIVGSIPLLFAIMLNYMAMGLMGFNLDMSTSLIASIAVGVGIDYTIHFMTNYRAERLIRDNNEEITRRTLKKSGKGIVTNATAVGLGFFVLCLSEFIVFRYIGILLAVVMLTSSILAMTVIPGILNTFDPKFMKRKNGKRHAV